MLFPGLSCSGRFHHNLILDAVGHPSLLFVLWGRLRVIFEVEAAANPRPGLGVQSLRLPQWLLWKRRAA